MSGRTPDMEITSSVIRPAHCTGCPEEGCSSRTMTSCVRARAAAVRLPAGPPPTTTTSCICALSALLGLLVIRDELLDTLIGLGVLDHELEGVVGDRGDVTSGECCVEDVCGSADGCCDDLGLDSVVLEDGNYLPNEVGSVLSDVVQASDEGGHEGGPGLCGEQCLQRGEDEGHVDLDTLGGEDLGCLQGLDAHGQFDVDVLVDLGELATVLD